MNTLNCHIMLKNIFVFKLSYESRFKKAMQVDLRLICLRIGNIKQSNLQSYNLEVTRHILTLKLAQNKKTVPIKYEYYAVKSLLCQSSVYILSKDQRSYKEFLSINPRISLAAALAISDSICIHKQAYCFHTILCCNRDTACQTGLPK